MAITWVFVHHVLSNFTGLYTSCMPHFSMNEYIVSVLLLHSSFLKTSKAVGKYTFLPKQESQGEYTHGTNTLPAYSNKVDLHISDMISMRLCYDKVNIEW